MREKRKYIEPFTTIDPVECTHIMSLSLKFDPEDSTSVALSNDYGGIWDDDEYGNDSENDVQE